MNEFYFNIGAISALIVVSAAVAGFFVTWQRRRSRLRQQERLEVAFSRAQTLRTRGGARLLGSHEA